MTAAFALLLSLAEPEGAGACEEVPPGAATAADPDTAAVYRAVGDDERAAGHADAARIAYREALRRDGADAGARAGLAALCVREAKAAPPPARPPDDFDRGVALMERGDRAGAIAAFVAARAEGPDPAATLLEAICRYELGDSRRARPLLEEARATPKVAGTALFFLGLIALEEDESARAASLFTAAASADAGLAGTAAGLARLSHREGRVVVSALSEAGYDSNVELTPDGTAARGGAADGYGSAVAGLFARPSGTTGAYLRATAQYRKQLRIESYDLGQGGAALGLRAGRGGRYAAAEYAYDFLTLGGRSYLSAHRLLATGRTTRGRFSLGATYAARFESFLTAATAQYSGLHHDVETEVGWQPAAAAAVGVGYHGGRDDTRDAALSYVEQGPVALLRLGLGGPARLVAEGRFTWRRYDAVDPDLGVERRDRYLDGALLGELDVADSWTVRATVTGRRALSDLSDFQYDKLVATLGVVYTLGVR
jgi:hypothetical protein